MQLTLSQFLAYLVTKKAFYGRLVSSLERIRRPGLGTMAVGLRDGRAVLLYDPAFLVDLPLSAGMFAVEHEMLHLVLDHIPRYLELLSVQPTEEDRKKAAAVYNIAMDCSINTMLRNHEGFEGIERHLKDKVIADLKTEIDELRARVKAEHAEACAKAKADGTPEPDAPEEPEMPPVDESKLGMVLPEKYDLPLEGSFEHYQYLLMKKVKLMQISLSFGGNTHDFWQGADSADGDGDGKPGEGKPKPGDGKPSPGEGKGEGKVDVVFNGHVFGDMSSEELLSAAHRVREQLKETMRQVIRSMGGSIDRGTLPGALEEWLKDYLADPIIPWWEIFATRAKMSRMSKYKRSAQQPNRALLALSEEDNTIIPAPGRIRDVAWRIFFMVDTSGSMSTESLEIAKSELFHMLAVDDGMEIRYMQGDCVVHFDQVLKSGDEVPAETPGRGGTDFDAYFAHMGQYVNDDQKAPDLVVVYTDGYAPAVQEKHRLPVDVPVLWLVTPQHSDHFTDGYGEVIVCDPMHNARRSKA